MKGRDLLFVVVAVMETGCVGQTVFYSGVLGKLHVSYSLKSGDNQTESLTTASEIWAFVVAASISNNRGKPPSTQSVVEILALVVLRETSGGLLAVEMSRMVKVSVMGSFVFWIFTGARAFCASGGGVRPGEEVLGSVCCWRGLEGPLVYGGGSSMVV